MAVILSGAALTDAQYRAIRGDRNSTRRIACTDLETAFLAAKELAESKEESVSIATVKAYAEKVLTDAGLLPTQATQLVTWLIAA
jgi:hypothetical protein